MPTKNKKVYLRFSTVKNNFDLKLEGYLDTKYDLESDLELAEYQWNRTKRGNK